MNIKVFVLFNFVLLVSFSFILFFLLMGDCIRKFVTRLPESVSGCKMLWLSSFGNISLISLWSFILVPKEIIKVFLFQNIMVRSTVSKMALEKDTGIHARMVTSKTLEGNVQQIKFSHNSHGYTDPKICLAFYDHDQRMSRVSLVLSASFSMHCT